MVACAYAQVRPSTNLLSPYSTPRPFGLQPQYRRPSYSRPIVPVSARPTLPPQRIQPIYQPQQPLYRSAEANARILKQTQDISSDGNSFQYR